jgi:hypothetical protein
MTEKEGTLFDLFFEGRVEYDEICELRIGLAHKIYKEEAVVTDDLRWQYIHACLTTSYAGVPIGVQLMIILNCVFIHKSLQKLIEAQFMRPTNIPEDFRDPDATLETIQTRKSTFFKAFMLYLIYVMTDWNSSDPLRSEENWPRSFEFLRRAWMTRDLMKPWNSVSTRCDLKEARVRVKQPTAAKGKGKGAGATRRPKPQ